MSIVAMRSGGSRHSSLGVLSGQLDVLALILNIDVHIWMVDATVKFFVIAQQYRIDVTFV